MSSRPILQPNHSGPSTPTSEGHPVDASVAGPISKTYAVPPRPKPGRKPGQTANDDTRRASNREAQKKFRSRQADKIQELNVENDLLQQRLDRAEAEAGDLRRQLQFATRSAQDAQTESNSLKRKLDDMQDTLQREAKRARNDVTKPKNPLDLPTPILPPPIDTSPSGAPTPPDDLEIDFTSFGRSAAINLPENCGFCEGTDYCMCKETMKDSDPLTIPPVPSSSSRQPGTCEQCQRDPEQARKCRDLAAAAQHTPEPGIDSPASLPSFAEFERMTCADFLHKAGSSQHDLRWKTILRNLHTYPHTSIKTEGVTQSERAPAMDLNASEAAHALAALSQTRRSGLSD